MGFRDLTPPETATVLETERVVRLAFTSPGEIFVVPVFYAWVRGCLCGFTTPGRKLEMAAANPLVGFQVDSTIATGLWEWASVSGQGTFQVLDDPAEAVAFALQLSDRLADAPPWAQEALQERFERLGRVAWRLQPAQLHGRAHGPGEGSTWSQEGRPHHGRFSASGL